MTILNNEYVHIDLEADNSLAVATWLSESEDMSLEEYYTTFDQIAELFAQHRVKKWLGDAVNFRKAVTPDMQNWVATVFTPKVIGAGLTKMAVVLPTEFIANLSLEQTVDEMQELNEQLFAVRYFAQLQDARNWLLS